MAQDCEGATETEQEMVQSSSGKFINILYMYMYDPSNEVLFTLLATSPRHRRHCGQGGPEQADSDHVGLEQQRLEFEFERQ